MVCGEDSHIAREGILRALEAEEDIEVVATCRDFDSLRMAVDDAADVALWKIPNATHQYRRGHQAR